LEGETEGKINGKTVFETEGKVENGFKSKMSAGTSRKLKDSTVDRPRQIGGKSNDWNFPHSSPSLLFWRDILGISLIVGFFCFIIKKCCIDRKNRQLFSTKRQNSFSTIMSGHGSQDGQSNFGYQRVSKTEEYEEDDDDD